MNPTPRSSTREAHATPAAESPRSAVGFPAFCFHCVHVMLDHVTMMTGYCLQARTCARCQRLGDCALVRIDTVPQ